MFALVRRPSPPLCDGMIRSVKCKILRHFSTFSNEFYAQHCGRCFYNVDETATRPSFSLKSKSLRMFSTCRKNFRNCGKCRLSFRCTTCFGLLQKQQEEVRNPRNAGHICLLMTCACEKLLSREVALEGRGGVHPGVHPVHCRLKTSAQLNAWASWTMK